MVNYGPTLRNKVVAGAVALSLVMPPAREVFGQNRTLASNTPATQTVVPSTVQFGGLDLQVQTLDRSISTTDMMSAAYRTGRLDGERWRNQTDGTRESISPDNALPYYGNMITIRETGGPNGLKALFRTDRTTNLCEFGMSYTNENNGQTGRNFQINTFSDSYRTATGHELRRVRMLVQRGQNSRGEEQYVVMALPADPQTGQLTGQQTISGVTGYPAVAMAYYPNREGMKLGSAAYIFVRDQ